MTTHLGQANSAQQRTRQCLCPPSKAWKMNRSYQTTDWRRAISFSNLYEKKGAMARFQKPCPSFARKSALRLDGTPTAKDTTADLSPPLTIDWNGQLAMQGSSIPSSSLPHLNFRRRALSAQCREEVGKASERAWGSPSQSVRPLVILICKCTNCLLVRPT